jgi:phosphoribosylamine--glycine ligase
VKVLVVGSGAREDALSWRLANSASCSAVFACPGNAGTASRGENWSDVSATDGRAIARRAREHHIDVALLGPETAIAAGVADQLRENGIATFGPGRRAGRLESSKIYAKHFMERHGVPTARARIVHSLDSARKAIDDMRGGCVVKADGLAAGKGVVVADDTAAALDVLSGWYGPSGIPGGGTNVLLEERMVGREVSVFALGDGRTLTPIAAACDYKRAGDGDSGPNTGGMGAYSPPLGFPEDMYDIVARRILDPVLRGLRADGEPYVGILYCGLMWTDAGPRVIEFNVRFGDPETQALVPRIRGDFARVVHQVATGARDRDSLEISGEACVAVVLATREYPLRSVPVSGLPADLALGAGRAAFWGTSALRDGRVDASGGRVLTVTALGDSVADARTNAYAAVADVARRFGDGRALTYRSDIAAGAAGSQPLSDAAKALS